MSGFDRLGKSKTEKSEYAGKDEFLSAFEAGRSSLNQLALLLTGSPEAASHCLSRALQECLASSSVCKHWTATWARRVVIRSAIDLVIGTGTSSSERNNDAEESVLDSSMRDPLHQVAVLQSVLDLSDLDRFVFVICILERYSVLDCALLLNRSPKEIYNIRQRAVMQMAQFNELDNGSSHLAPQ